MPSLTIDLSEETAADFAALPTAAQNELTRRVNAFVSASLHQKQIVTVVSDDAGEDTEGAAWWASLTKEQQEAERDAVLRSIADGEAGRIKPASEVLARLQAKFADKRIAAS